MKIENGIVDLETESTNSRSSAIDVLTAHEIVGLINDMDKEVAFAVEKALHSIAIGAEKIAAQLSEGGRLIYVGAGSSGRMGVLDAVELKPTYNVPDDQAFGMLAGGKEAMFLAVEGAEDRFDQGVDDLRQVQVSNKDVVVGIAASGRTPYTMGALSHANIRGSYTIAIVNNTHSVMAKMADCAIEVIVGSEIISGSTRMKAGTSQKMVVNMLSTTAMILMGKVYENYMVHVQPTNEKLVIRSIHIIQSLTGLSFNDSRLLFEEANRSVACALVMAKTHLAYPQAQALLDKSKGNVRKAMNDHKEQNI